MKVSRKVGRRKHSRSSSISRRRLRSKKSYKKNSYRKKNAKTQKGGKRGRGYKRMRSHTHKRGKRFHRGGVICVDGGTKNPKELGRVIDLSSGISDPPQLVNTDVAFYPGLYKKCISHNMSHEFGDKGGAYVLEFSNVNLVYTKKTGALGGVFNKSEVSSPFKVVIIKEINGNFCVILTRTGKGDKIGEYEKYEPGASLEVYFIVYRKNLSRIQLALTESSQLDKMKSNHLETYNFNFKKNAEYFEYFKNAAEFLSKHIGDALNEEQRLSEENATIIANVEAAEKQKKNEAKKKKDVAFEEVRELGDKLEVKLDGQTEPIKFSDFKRELIELAQSNKQQIDDQTLDTETKKRRTDQIDKIVKVIVNAQYKLMKASFIHLKVYGNYNEFYSGKRQLDNINKLKEQMNKLVSGTHDNTNGKGGILSLTNSVRDADDDDDDDLDREQNQRLEQELTQPPVQNVAVLAAAPALTSLASAEPDAAPLAGSEVSETLPPAGSNVAAEGSDAQGSDAQGSAAIRPTIFASPEEQLEHNDNNPSMAARSLQPEQQAITA
jgi:hypothetical protein